MDSYDIHSSADRPTKEPGIQIDQRNGKPRRWEQKLVQIKTMEGEFSVTMWASGTSDDEFSNSDHNPDELDYLAENGTDNDTDTTFPTEVQAISDNHLQLQKSESVLQQQQQLFFHPHQEQFLQQLTLPLSQQKSSQECQLALDNPALPQNDHECEPTTEAAAIGNVSFALGKLRFFAVSRKFLNAAYIYSLPQMLNQFYQKYIFNIYLTNQFKLNL